MKEFDDCSLAKRTWDNEIVSYADEVKDARLFMLANSRMAHADIAAAIPAEDVYRDLGISTEDLADANEVEIE